MKNLTFLKTIAIILLLFSCAKKEKSNSAFNKYSSKINQNKSIMTLDLTEIKKHIELQKKIESDEVEYDNPYELTPKDLELCFQIINEGLKKNGYKTPDIKTFNTFIPLKNDSWQYAKYFDVNCLEWNKDNIFSHFQLVERNQYIFSSDKKFITDFFLLNEIIDVKQDNNYNIKVPQNIINRNKYLFNKDKASLVWLKFNDQVFLESLVKIFGYVQDKDLLKWVLDRNLNDDEFDKLLFTKTCNNKYIFHKEIFEVMTKADNKSKENYLLYLRGKTELPKVEDANFSDTARIYALYCYYATKFTQSIDQGYVYTFFPKLNDEKFEEEFKRSNYYNIPDFKKLFEDTKNGGIGLPM